MIFVYRENFQYAALTRQMYHKSLKSNSKNFNLKFIDELDAELQKKYQEFNSK